MSPHIRQGCHRAPARKIYAENGCFPIRPFDGSDDITLLERVLRYHTLLGIVKVSRHNHESLRPVCRSPFDQNDKRVIGHLTLLRQLYP